MNIQYEENKTLNWVIYFIANLKKKSTQTIELRNSS